MSVFGQECEYFLNLKGTVTWTSRGGSSEPPWAMLVPAAFWLLHHPSGWWGVKGRSPRRRMLGFLSLHHTPWAGGRVLRGALPRLQKVSQDTQVSGASRGPEPSQPLRVGWPLPGPQLDWMSSKTLSGVTPSQVFWESSGWSGVLPPGQLVSKTGWSPLCVNKAWRRVSGKYISPPPGPALEVTRPLGPGGAGQGAVHPAGTSGSSPGLSPLGGPCPRPGGHSAQI